MLRKAIAILLICTVSSSAIWPATSILAQEQARTDLTTSDSMRQFERFMNSISELQSLIDRSQFDLDALLDTLDYDAERIIRFVEEEVFFEQYPGVLRGAQGTLMSRSGNSLDQSILLAGLLKDAGYESRIVGTKISSAQAANLLEQILVDKPPRPPIGDSKEIAAVFESMAADFGLPQSQLLHWLNKPVGSSNANSKNQVAIVTQETEKIVTAQ